MTIDVPKRDIVRLTVERNGEVIVVRDIPYSGAVDNKLLTTLDNLFQANILDRFVSFSVRPGKGIDKTSLLYRIITTLGAALQRT